MALLMQKRLLWRLILPALLLCCAPLLSQAQPQRPKPADIPLGEEQQSRYESIVTELACPSCAGSSVADSASPIALGIRNQVRRMVADHMDDDAIREALVARYGQEVDLEPPKDLGTAPLWLLPAVVLGLGLVVVLGRSRRRSRQ